MLCVGWNDSYRKLTSSDDKGLIIVWILHKGVWFEEMINNRSKSIVRDMKWTADGQKICIVYEDGAVIVGSVDGNRLWGKELKTYLSHVEWSPDGKFLLFGSAKGNVHIFDSKSGNKLMSMKITCVDNLPNPNLELQQPPPTELVLSGIQWYNGARGYVDPNAPSLAICYVNGRCQLMRSEADESPVILETGLIVSEVQWNINGTILAIAGTQEVPNEAKLTDANQPDKKQTAIVQFYSAYGQVPFFVVQKLTVTASKIAQGTRHMRGIVIMGRHRTSTSTGR